MMVERAVYDMQSENVSEEEIEAVLTEINRRLAEDDGSARQNEKEIILRKRQCCARGCKWLQKCGSEWMGEE